MNNHLGSTAGKDERSICFIVEDHAPLRIVLGEWLRTAFPDITFVELETGEDAVELAKTLRPDLVVLDIGMEGIDGIEATRQIKTLHPSSMVIIHTIHDSIQYRNDARLAGAEAFIPKNQIRPDLITVVRKLLASCR